MGDRWSPVLQATQCLVSLFLYLFINTGLLKGMFSIYNTNLLVITINVLLI